MSNDLYAVSVPVFLRGLATLTHVLEKTEAYATERKIEPSALLTARLFPDLCPLIHQMRIACDTAKRSTARLTGIEAPSFEDTEQGFADIKARIGKTVDFVAGVTADSFLGAAERGIEMKTAGTTVTLTGIHYLTRFALPNFYFHVTTAYDICRHNGVPLGKADFLGSLSS
jgi:hypothetical protein